MDNALRRHGMSVTFGVPPETLHLSGGETGFESKTSVDRYFTVKSQSSPSH